MLQRNEQAVVVAVAQELVELSNTPAPVKLTVMWQMAADCNSSFTISVLSNCIRPFLAVIWCWSDQFPVSSGGDSWLSLFYYVWKQHFKPKLALCEVQVPSILAHHCRKNITRVLVVWLIGWGTGTLQWNRAVFDVITNTCAFLLFKNRENSQRKDLVLWKSRKIHLHGLKWCWELSCAIKFINSISFLKKY